MLLPRRLQFVDGYGDRPLVDFSSIMPQAVELAIAHPLPRLRDGGGAMASMGKSSRDCS